MKSLYKIGIKQMFNPYFFWLVLYNGMGYLGLALFK